MKNVYDEVRQFYEHDAGDYSAVRRDWVEGFLRQRAWAGAGDDELRDIWANLRMFLLYHRHTEAEDPDELPYHEYSRVIKWLAAHIKGFKATLRPVRRFFNVLVDFYRYLALKKVVADTSELEQAAREIAGGRRVKLPDGRSMAALTEELGAVVSDIVEGLMIKLGDLYQKKEYSDDLQRALFLFAGPLNTLPDGDEEAVSLFWQEFWDYFLFDYRLLASDRTPLAEFAATGGNGFGAEERQILEELLGARFTVFTVRRVLSEDWAECQNVFTGEEFPLPRPDFDYRSMKKLLFFGHVFSRETIIVNHITSIEVSANLRRRIKEEAQQQKAIFEIQQPGATWADFFDRHALAFRHTVDALITLAKVNVTPFAQLGRQFPLVPERRAADPRVSGLFAKVMPDYGFSLHDRVLAGRLWHDFCQLTEVRVRKPGAWAAAVVYAYAQINSPQGIAAEQLAVDLGVSTSSVYADNDKIFRTLALAKFDPRYLNEEGFVYSLFMS